MALTPSLLMGMDYGAGGMLAMGTVCLIQSSFSSAVFEGILYSWIVEADCIPHIFGPFLVPTPSCKNNNTTLLHSGNLN